ncbi:MAG: glucose-1-phosphate adenylyltransferase, partial [Pedobacter sp.]
HLLNHEFEYVLILSGDQLYQMDFKEMVQAHIDAGVKVTLATIPVNAKDAPDFGILKANEENIITSFIEKPKTNLEDWTSDTGPEMHAEGRDYLASMGIYIFNRDLLIKIFAENADEKDFGKEIIPRMLTEHNVLSYQYDGYWTDIGNISSFFEANLGLTDDIPKFNLFDSHHSIFTRARMLPPSKILGTTLDKTIIAEGCILEAESIKHAVIGIRSRIGTGTHIESCYIMGSDKYQTLIEIEQEKGKKPLIGIGDNCKIVNAIIDKNSRIGDNVEIIGGAHLPDGDHELYTVKDGIVVVKKGAIVPDGTKI